MQRGLLSQLGLFLFNGTILLASIALVVATSIAFLPTLAVAVVAFTTPVGIAVVVVSVIVAVSFAGCLGALLSPFLSAVGALQKLGAPLLVAVAVGLLVGLLGGPALVWTLDAGHMAVYSAIMGESLLTPVAVRCS